MSDFRSGFAWEDAGAYTLKLRHTGSDNIGGGSRRDGDYRRQLHAGD